MTMVSGQQQSNDDTAGQGVQGDEPPAGADGTEQPAATGDQDDPEQGGDAAQDDQGGRRNREANYRRRAQAAEGRVQQIEAERDSLRDQLDTLYRQIVGGIATAHGLPEVQLLESAGHELASFILDDGTVDTAQVIEATKETMSRYSITPKSRPKANAQQGAHGTPSPGRGLDDVLNKALGR